MEALFWEKVAALGQVAGAIATFAAVCVSLWLARSERRAHVRARAGLRMIFAGDGSPFEDVISVQVTNHSLRSARISSVGWRTGWMKYGPRWLAFQHAVQKFDRPISSISSPRPPFDLGPGQEVTFYLSPEPFKKGGEWRNSFFNRHFPWRQNPSPAKICTVVSIVASKAVVTRVERSLESFLATGVIANGAEKANQAANAKSGA